MTYPNILLAVALALIYVATPSYAQNVQLSASAEAAVIADLESGEHSRINAAFNVLPDPYNSTGYDSLYKEKISYSVALALIAAAEKQIDIAFGQDDDVDYHESHGHFEFASALKEYVIPLKIPEAIPALLKAAQFGMGPAYAVADFGPDVVYTIIDYMDNPERTGSEISGGFDVLTSTVITWRPLDASIRAAVKEIAVRYLERAEEYFSDDDGYTCITGAISLARVLGDTDLKQMVIDIIPFEQERGRGGDWAQYTVENWDTWDELQINISD